MAKKRKVGRDSSSGEFISVEEARRRPATTTVESVVTHSLSVSQDETRDTIVIGGIHYSRDMFRRLAEKPELNYWLAQRNELIRVVKHTSGDRTTVEFDLVATLHPDAVDALDGMCERD